MIDVSKPDFENTPASTRRPEFSYSLADPLARPQVTIVTPFYDEGPVFHETARSVFRQSFQQWEWIIVNDAATDAAALEVLAEYRTRDRRIHVVDQAANQGPSAARNLAFRMTRTQWVVHLDSDNLLEPTALEKWLWYLETHPECSFVKGFSVGFGAETYLWTSGFHEGAAFLTSNRVDMTSMIRLDVHRAVGGFDESIREGLEDWEFWLRCASRGFWGGTVPEYLDWYRRRGSHADRWKTWDGGTREQEFGRELRKRFSSLSVQGFPSVRPAPHIPFATVSDELPCANVLARTTKRLLLILPWLVMGGADKFNLDLVQELARRGWETTIATTLATDHSWHAEFQRHTPDIFLLHNFLPLTDFPRFLRYLIQSRQVDVVMVSQSEFGYQLLPYLRAHFPQVTFLDFCHIEEDWKNGGHPRLAVEYQELLDLNLVCSEHLRRWMIGRGAGGDRIQVCHLGVDTEMWRPDAVVRRRVRNELGVSQDVPIILYAGRICEQKQPRVFANAMLQLHRMGVSLLALVAGDGPDLAWLRRFVEEHRLDSAVRLLGGVPSRRVSELMATSDIFFLPSAREGIALSIYEAMATGVPVVGADVGGQRELVTPECGILIERADEEQEAATYARTLAGLVADAERRKSMGIAGRARVSAGFRLQDVGQRMAWHFDSAVRLHEAEPRPVPGLGLGRATATQAVEFTRTAVEFDWLWNTWHRGQPSSASGDSVPWRHRVYAACRVLYGPLYRRGRERGGAWYFPIADRVKAALLRSHDSG